jgi:hypothetical protein
MAKQERLPVPPRRDWPISSGVQRKSEQIAQDNLLVARSAIVRKYRINPKLWPDGIDSKWDRWYRKEDWTDSGEYIGPPNPPKRPDPGVDAPAVDPVTDETRSTEVVDPDRAERRKRQQREWLRKKKDAKA